MRNIRAREGRCEWKDGEAAVLLRGLLAVAVLAAGIALAARLSQEVSVAGTLDADGQAPAPAAAPPPTIALAPLSLGNSLAAATLRTRHPSPPQAEEPAAVAYVQTLRVGRGDTLASLLALAGVPRREAHAAARALAEVYSPRRIRPGQDVTLAFEAPGEGGGPDRFLGFTLALDFARQVAVARPPDGGFRATRTAKALVAKPAIAAGTIQSSLFDDALKAGVPLPVIVELIRAYSWDVDFQRGIHPGDRFRVLYEKLFDEAGTPVHSGRILAAVLTLGARRHAVYLHTTEDGITDYFDEMGRSARKALMRTPIDGARLTSRFGARRHPILGYTRMHRGIDFAAPRGTPIYAAGDGTVTYAGRKGAYGKYVRIRHNGRYTTAYGHMSRIRRGLRRGRRVAQGQVIGYVGSTGRSTGPHLHYEILAQGRRVNPLKVKMPSGRRLAGAELARFQAARAEADRLAAALAAPAELARRDD